MISIARTLGAPETVPAGKAGHQRIDRVVLLVEPSGDVGDDVHDVAVALDEEARGHVDGADLGDAADVVAAEVEQHQVLGALLGVLQQRLRQRLVLGVGGAARRRAGDGADGHLAFAHAHQDLRARADEGEAAEVEMEEERRGVGAAQGAVERE